MLRVSEIEIIYCSAGGCTVHEVCAADKTLPYFSVAQSVSGEYEVQIGSEHVVTSPMGAFAAPALVRQQIKHLVPKTGEMIVQWAFLDVTVNGFYALDALYDFPLLFSAKEGRKLYDLISSLRKTEERVEACAVAAHKASAYSLLAFLMQFAREREYVLADDHLRYTAEYMRENYAESLSVEKLSRIAGLSQSSFFYKFKNTYQRTPMEYLNEIRLRQGAKLLLGTHKSVAEVAALCGYEDPLYFSKAFRRKFSTSPLQYRKIQKW